MKKKVGMLRFHAALDNHDPYRSEASGTAEIWHGVDGIESIRICDPDLAQFKDFNNSLFLIDDGRFVVPHYSAGWSVHHNGGPAYLIIEPMPTNPTGRVRADDGRVIDYRNWQLGPKRAYHLKVTRI